MRLTLEPLQLPLSLDASGGVRVGGTRVPLDTVIYAFLEGATAEEIVEDFPTLDVADIHVLIGYYLRNRDAVDAYLREREVEAEAIRAEHLARFPQDGIRERLLARRRSE